MNANGESYLRFSTLGGVFLMFRRVVSVARAKSRITNVKVKLLAFIAPGSREVTDRRGGGKRQAGFLVSNHSFICVLTSVTQSPILCRAVWGDG